MEDHLRFNEGPFADARGVLFPGDTITKIGFTKDSTNTSVCIQIKEIHLEFSEATTLYQQRRRGIVHILNLQTGGNGLRISSVIGFSNAKLESIQIFDRVQQRAELDKNDQTLLLQQAASDRPHPTQVLGRLDAD